MHTWQWIQRSRLICFLVPCCMLIIYGIVKLSHNFSCLQRVFCGEYSVCLQVAETSQFQVSQGDMKVLLLLIQDTLHTIILKYWACMATSLKAMEFIRKLDSIILNTEKKPVITVCGESNKREQIKY